MTQLVISVRTAEEARLAWQSGADVVDLKEPARGAMGRADSHVASQVRAEIPAAALSIAMGELADVAACEFDWQVVSQFQFAKAAPAACATVDRWSDRWHAWSMRLPPHVARVVVAYCDFEAANSPPPDKLLAAAIERKADGFLLDTYRKEGLRLFDLLSAFRVNDFARTAHKRGVWLAVAGSLRLGDIPQAMDAWPDFIAFRAAACKAGRRSTLSGERVMALKRALEANQSALEGARD